jgi:PIN domain nuclease of toxin-antitoxin system
MATTREYKAIKNFVHNELKLSKEQFYTLLIKAIQDEAKAYAQRYIQQNPPDRIIIESTKNEIFKLITDGRYSSTGEKFMANIGREVASQLDIHLKEKK